MKNTFNTLRKKVNGFFVYVVHVKDDKGWSKKYLFEITRKLTLSKVMDIEKRFADDDIIFATADESLLRYTCTVDAANLYLVPPRKMRPIYVYEKKKFYKTMLVTFGNGYKRLYKKLAIAEIQCDYADF